MPFRLLRLHCCFLFAVFTLLGCAQGLSAAGPRGLEVGAKLPDFTLNRPADAGSRVYLGLKTETADFTPAGLSGDLLLIEIFSMYCPHCQHDAPGLNEFYQLVEKDPQLQGKLKIIGIGAGNSAFEVEVFQDKYQVAFPLFADPDLALHQLFGGVRTPYFIGVYLDGERRGRIFFSQLAGFSDPADFLQKFIAAGR